MFVGVLSAIRDMIGFTIVDKRWILLLQLRDLRYQRIHLFLEGLLGCALRKAGKQRKDSRQKKGKNSVRSHRKPPF